MKAWCCYCYSLVIAGISLFFGGGWWGGHFGSFMTLLIFIATAGCIGTWKAQRTRKPRAALGQLSLYKVAAIQALFISRPITGAPWWTWRVSLSALLSSKPLGHRKKDRHQLRESLCEMGTDLGTNASSPGQFLLFVRMMWRPERIRQMAMEPTMLVACGMTESYSHMVTAYYGPCLRWMASSFLTCFSRAYSIIFSSSYVPSYLGWLNTKNVNSLGISLHIWLIFPWNCIFYRAKKNKQSTMVDPGRSWGQWNVCHGRSGRWSRRSGRSRWVTRTWIDIPSGILR